MPLVPPFSMHSRTHQQARRQSRRTHPRGDTGAERAASAAMRTGIREMSRYSLYETSDVLFCIRQRSIDFGIIQSTGQATHELVERHRPVSRICAIDADVAAAAEWRQPAV